MTSQRRRIDSGERRERNYSALEAARERTVDTGKRPYPASLLDVWLLGRLAAITPEKAWTRLLAETVAEVEKDAAERAARAIDAQLQPAVQLARLIEGERR
jgi:hypothetical protein